MERNRFCGMLSDLQDVDARVRNYRSALEWLGDGPGVIKFTADGLTYGVDPGCSGYPLIVSGLKQFFRDQLGAALSKYDQIMAELDDAAVTPGE